MRGTNRILGTLVVVGLVVAVAACAEGNLDSGGSANVVLEVQNIPNAPPVTAAPAPGGDGCTFTVTNLNVTLANKKKSELAASPYSDIVLEEVAITYQWADPTITVTDDVQPIGGTVPVSGTQTVSFTPIRLDYLTSEISGRTAGMLLVFRGHTVDGKAVESAAGGTALSINSCTTTTVCGDGSINGLETCDDANVRAGDGCSAACQIEQGWLCEGQPSVCNPIITP